MDFSLVADPSIIASEMRGVASGHLSSQPLILPLGSIDHLNTGFLGFLSPPHLDKVAVIMMARLIHDSWQT